MSGFKVGLFLPIGEHGFILSKNSPPIHATYGYNKEVTILAEKLNFDFVFSMIKYRGVGVETPFWHSTLESITLSAALAECTNRIQIIGSASILTVPPAIMAKMVATIDHISNGRFGLNIVTGAFPSEMQQMDLWQGDHDARYDQAAEYVSCLRRLWTEDRVTFEGDYYKLVDCESNPKPLRTPAPEIACAGASEKGLRFTAENGDYSFVTMPTPELIIDKAAAVKRMGSEAGREIKVLACLVPIVGETEEAARQRYHHYVDGRDQGGVERLMEEFGISQATAPAEMFDSVMFFGTPLIGDPQQIADTLFNLHRNGVDGAVLMLPDYIKDQVTIAHQVMPLLTRLLEESAEPGVGAGSL